MTTSKKVIPEESSQELAVRAQQAVDKPRSLADLLKAQMQQVTSTESSANPSSNYISTKGGYLSLKGQSCPNNELNGVLIAAPIARTYYAGKYDPNVKTPPKCQALSMSAQGMGPAASVEAPENDTCLGCPKDQWGSAPNGGKGKACKETRHMMFLPYEASQSVYDAQKAEVYILRPPVTSLKNYTSYATQLAQLFSLPPLAVVTRVRCAPHPQNLYEVQFNKVEMITDEAVLHALIERSKQEVASVIESFDKGEALESLGI